MHAHSLCFFTLQNFYSYERRERRLFFSIPKMTRACFFFISPALDTRCALWNCGVPSKGCFARLCVPLSFLLYFTKKGILTARPTKVEQPSMTVSLIYSPSRGADFLRSVFRRYARRCAGATGLSLHGRLQREYCLTLSVRLLEVLAWQLLQFVTRSADISLGEAGVVWEKQRRAGFSCFRDGEFYKHEVQTQLGSKIAVPGLLTYSGSICYRPCKKPHNPRGLTYTSPVIAAKQRVVVGVTCVL